MYPDSKTNCHWAVIGILFDIYLDFEALFILAFFIGVTVISGYILGNTSSSQTTDKYFSPDNPNQSIEQSFMNSPFWLKIIGIGYGVIIILITMGFLGFEFDWVGWTFIVTPVITSLAIVAGLYSILTKRNSWTTKSKNQENGQDISIATLLVLGIFVVIFTVLIVFLLLPR